MKAKRMLCAVLLAAVLLGTAVPALAMENGRLLKVAHCKRAALRAWSSVKSKRLATLPAGALVVYGGLKEGGFRLVRWGDRWGYVGEAYLEEASRALRVSKKVWLRSAPSEDGAKLKKLKKGALLLAVSDGGNGYFYACADGVFGYVNAKSVRAATAKQGRKGVTLEEAELALGSGGTIRLPALYALRCFGSDGSGREYVCANGEFGFVRSDKVYIPGKRR